MGLFLGVIVMVVVETVAAPLIFTSSVLEIQHKTKRGDF